MAQKILVISKNGQIASALNKFMDLSVYEYEHLSFPRITNAADFYQQIRDYFPTLIINASAYTDVNRAESDAEHVAIGNVELPKKLAEIAKDLDIPLIHFSTDYVFDGTLDRPYKEDDLARPINIYGKTKLLGEQAIERVGGKYIIFRTSWVYDELHKNFLTTMLKKAYESEVIDVVSDQIGAPTYAGDLARASISMIGKDFPSGVYHLCSSGETSWQGFAQEIFKIAKESGASLKVKEVRPLSSEDFVSPAKRPKNSRLDCSKARSVLEIELEEWDVVLKKVMEKMSWK